MYRNLIYLVSFVLVLCFAAGTVLAELVSYYPLNEGSQLS